MATMTMTFEVPDTKVLDRKMFEDKVSDLIKFFINSLPDVKQDETEYIMSNPKIMKAIEDGDKQIASGNFTTTKLEDLWK